MQPFKRLMFVALALFDWVRFAVFNRITYAGREHLAGLPPTGVLLVANHLTYYVDVLAIHHAIAGGRCSPFDGFRANLDVGFIAAFETLNERGLVPRLFNYCGAVLVIGDPRQLGAKGANSVTPFMLSLERLCRASLIEDYWQVFLLFGAAIQMIDDWEDLERDLAIGHYSYVTLGFENLVRSHEPARAAGILRVDKEHVRATYTVSKDMIAQARMLLDKLQDRFLIRLVDITELRLETYYRCDLKLA